jgi:predicted double-glycine peptidase
VVVSVNSRRVVVQDPLLGQFNTSLLVFEQAWSGSEFLTILIEQLSSGVVPSHRKSPTLAAVRPKKGRVL